MKEATAALKNGYKVHVYVMRSDEDEYRVQFIGPRGGLLFSRLYNCWEMKQLADLFNAGYKLSGS